MKNSLFSEGLVVLLILLWTYTGVNKLISIELFRFQLLGHPLLLNHVSSIAWLLPVIELIIAVLLILPFTRKLGLWASTALLTVLTIYIIYLFIFYPHKPCACGGVISKLGWGQHLVLNISFLVVNNIAIRLTYKPL